MAATGMVRDADGTTVKGVEIDGSVIDADAVVIAMGPGSRLAAQWMSLPAIQGERSPSIVYNTGTHVSADALFLEMEIYGKTTPSRCSLARMAALMSLLALTPLPFPPIQPT